jgi:predicted transcriptional regulator YdeE
MTTPLMKLFVNDLAGYQPRIVDLERPIPIVGMSVDTTLKAIYRDVPALGRRFKELKQAHPIPNLKEPWAFAAVSCGYDKATGAMTYMMGDVVSTASAVPEGMVAFEIPAIKYAVFPVRPRNRFGWGLAIASAKGYAYTVWMPGSGFEPAGAIDDFEYHDELSTRKRDPEIDLYVAIRSKASK